MIEISEEVFVEKHWHAFSTHMKSAFNSGLHNFIVSATTMSREKFIQNYDRKSFGRYGAWQPRKDNWWSRKFTHPLMYDTGSLRKNIRINVDGEKDVLNRSHKTYVYRGEIFTEEKSVAIQGKRGKNKDGSYAAIHNDPVAIGARYKDGSIPIQRQFIGYDTLLDHRVEKYCVPFIFKEFPK